MNAYRHIRLGLIVAAALLVQSTFVSAEAAPPAKAASSQGDAQCDGQHDFDFMVGNWNATLKRRVKPLSGSNEWIEFEGKQITISIWGGRGTMDEFTVHSPETNTHIEGLTVRLYNPESHQWNIYWANSKKGNFDLPPMTGRFHNGRGEFYDQESFEGRTIYVRYVWSDIKPDSARFEQAYSDDGGKTWEANWISEVTRMKE